MSLQVDNRQNRHSIPLAELRKKTAVILKALERPNAELSLVLVSDAQIAELNAQYLRRSGPTNVIAFPMGDPPFASPMPCLLGDVVISVDTAAREADAAGLAFETRFDELLVHGILHLCGYDHETSPQAAEEMADKTEELLALLSAPAR